MVQPITLPNLYLASQSPRRRQILESLEIPFKIVLPTSEEITPTVVSIENGIVENARAKAASVLSALPKNQSAIVIGADTLVVLKNRVMGKPSNAREVFEMLEELSGATHEVITGLALLSTAHGERVAFAKSSVTFKSLSKDLIQQYANTREPYDKAGSYAVQGLGAIFIEKISGSYTNVMGFPLELFLQELSQLVPFPLTQWFQR
jgi:septum formation protein